LRPDRIALIDRWVAKPLCAACSLFERLRRLRARPAPEGPRRIVFVKLIEMGSTVLACPAFAEAEKLVGRENLFILVFAPNRPILEVLRYFRPENVIAIDDRNLLAFAIGLLRALFRVWRERIDTAIDMEGLTSSSALITFLTRAPRRVGFYNFTSQGPYRGRLLTHELNYNFQHHVSRQFVALVRAAARSREEVPLLKERIPDQVIELPEFVPTSEGREEVRALLREAAGTDPGRLLLLNPNCSDLLPLRRWPSERFVELGRRLLVELPDATLVMTGAPSEAEEAARIARAIGSGRAFSLAGRTSLQQLLVLYSLADLLVSNDSGPVHFAALTPVPVVALFGPETPLLYGPLSRRARVLQSGLACSPCVNILNHRMSPCTDNQCMQRITVEEVLAAARELLAA
jgi:lipopolysaccharide heptosyltransferase II